MEVLGVELRRKRSGADEIAEHHRDVPALRGGCGRCGCLWRRCRGLWPRDGSTGVQLVTELSTELRVRRIRVVTRRTSNGQGGTTLDAELAAVRNDGLAGAEFQTTPDFHGAPLVK